METLEAQRRGEPTTAAHLIRLMKVRYGVSGATIHDLLGTLMKKKVIWWEHSDLPYNPAVWKVFHEAEDRHRTGDL